MNHQELVHRQFVESVEEWLLGELDAQRDREMEIHFNSCPECARVAEQTAELLSLARSTQGITPSHARMESLYDNMMGHLEEENVFTRPQIPPRDKSAPRTLEPVRFLAVAAIFLFLLLGAGAVSSHLQRTNDFQIPYLQTSQASLLIPKEVELPLLERQRQFEEALSNRGPESSPIP